MCQSQSPNSSHPTPFPLGIHTFVLYICVSISAWQFLIYHWSMSIHLFVSVSICTQTHTHTCTHTHTHTHTYPSIYASILLVHTREILAGSMESAAVLRKPTCQGTAGSLEHLKVPPPDSQPDTRASCTQPPGNESWKQLDGAWKQILPQSSLPVRMHLGCTLWDPGQRTQLSCAWTPDPQETWNNKHVLF